METKDHDTLIRIEEQVKFLTAKVSTLTDDHEKRIRSIEQYVWKAIGALTVVQVGMVIYLSLRK